MIICVGGEDDKVVLRSVEMFDPDTCRWKPLACLPFAISKHGMVSSGTCMYDTCADPESFLEEVQLFRVFFYFSKLGEIGSKYHYKLAIIDQPVKRPWWTNTDCWLVSFVVLQGI